MSPQKNAARRGPKNTGMRRKTAPNPTVPNSSKSPATTAQPQGRKPCPLAGRCGGCQLQNMEYTRQLRWKQGLVQRLLGRYGPVSPIIGMENPFHYRCKVQAAFGVTRKGEVISGVYQASTHRIVPVENCLIEDETADAIIGTIRSLCADFRIIPYQEDSGAGFLRHVLVRRGFHSGQVMVVLVAASPILPSKNNFVRALRQRHPEITTIVLNINRRNTSMVLGEQDKVLFGPGYIEDSLCGCVFRISPQSFYQVNPVQTEVLYRKAVELAGLTGKETVIDAYCGTGTIGLVAAKSAELVVGVESNPDAVRDAVANARRNNAGNARFFCADAGEFMRDMAQDGEQADVVFLDPPRAGSDERFLSSLVTLGPRRVVYISCNPATQARDLAYLTRHGYQVTALQPVDMFPFTNHVENIALLSNAAIKSSAV